VAEKEGIPGLPPTIDRWEHMLKGMAVLGPEMAGLSEECWKKFLDSDEAWMRLSVDDKVYAEIPIKALPVLRPGVKPSFHMIPPLPYNKVRAELPTWAMMIWKVELR
jgi:hypothetical protein